MSRAMVAENSSVRRVSGIALSRVSSSSLKPRSSISSASSSTTARRLDRFNCPRDRWSHRRPGVPTTMWQPADSARASLRGSIPPTQDTMRAPVWPYSHSSSLRTCRASSRVGAITRASGAPGSGQRPLSSSRVLAMARPKATVLPEPVRAETSRSRPSASGAMTAA